VTQAWVALERTAVGRLRSVTFGLLLTTSCLFAQVLHVAAAPATLTFSEFPVGTLIRDQYKPRGVVFSDLGIINDRAFPDSPVLQGSGAAGFNRFGAAFVNADGSYRPIRSFAFDVGPFRGPNELIIGWFKIVNNQLVYISQKLNTKAGIERINVSSSEDIWGFNVDRALSPLPLDYPEWRIDNFTFDAIGGGCTTDCPVAGTLQVVSPFKLGASDLRNLDLARLLPGLGDLSGAAAAGLAADQTSTAIALYRTTDATRSVRFEVTNGATLQSFYRQVLATGPIPGTSTLTVPASSFIRVGADYYAAALVLPPARSILPVFSQPMLVRAQQGTAAPKELPLALVPPPVILVHGLWGSRDSLAAIRSHLASRAPWSSRPGLLRAIEYPRDVPFDATGANGPAAVLKVAVRDTLATLERQGIVAGRVDVVAHSMGGLVGRHYASQPDYRGPKNRFRGDFHTIVTLNTPEQGSALATYLTSLGIVGARPQPGRSAFTWNRMCASLTQTVQECFRSIGNPIAGADGRVQSGAVYSLRPGRGSLANPALLGPNIPDAIWRATVTTVGAGHPVPLSLNNIIATITPVRQTPTTVAAILGSSQNDGIVTAASQGAGAAAAQRASFTGLAHTGPLYPWSVFAPNVLQDDRVDGLVECWLKLSGSAGCRPAAAALKAEAAPGGQPAPEAVPLRSMVPLVLALPRDLSLAEPVEVAVRPPAGEIAFAELRQRDERGRILAVGPAVLRRVGNILTVAVTPAFPGAVEFELQVMLADGTVAQGRTTAHVGLPAGPPLSVRADAFVDTVHLTVDGTARAYRLRPEAIFATSLGQHDQAPVAVSLDHLAQFALHTGSNPGVIELTPDGIVRALGKGRATIEARFAGRSASIEVIVE
jgi:pimeloyl-ACP methyl ester carboxylesterase